MWYKNLLKNLTNIFFTLVELFLGLRLILKLFGANTGDSFVKWTYKTSEPLLYPFQGMFNPLNLKNGVILEFSTIFAIIVYALLAWLILKLIDFLFKPATQYQE